QARRRLDILGEDVLPVTPKPTLHRVVGDTNLTKGFFDSRLAVARFTCRVLVGEAVDDFLAVHQQEGVVPTQVRMRFPGLFVPLPRTVLGVTAQARARYTRSGYRFSGGCS